ncbi:MAG: leucine-rich repeat domain-containing protein [Bacteroidia bacterium]
MRIVKIIIVFLFVAFSTFSQVPLLDSLTLATYHEYTDLNEALKNPDDVIKLSLRKKKFKEFPREVYAFKNLQYLDISKNSINEIPDSITTFTSLQYLICSKCGLKRLTNHIGKLKNLKYLNVNQNDIERLPYSFGELENLEIADMWSNELEYFPETLNKLTKLKLMDLRNILIPQNNQDNIQAMLPHAKIYFSPPCKCSW